MLRWGNSEQALRQKSSTATMPDTAIDAAMTVLIDEILMVSPTITVKRLQTHLATFYSDKKQPTHYQLGKLIKANKDAKEPEQ
ncbi:MAG: hypothetical protein HRT35_07525 [Algicola sp.]|nr:hypothetical protein [Algicola sp.]